MLSRLTHQLANQFLFKYQPSSGQSSSLLMKASCLRLKLVELNFFASFTIDDQSTLYVSNTLYVSKALDTYKNTKDKATVKYSKDLEVLTIELEKVAKEINQKIQERVAEAEEANREQQKRNIKKKSKE